MKNKFTLIFTIILVAMPIFAQVSSTNPRQTYFAGYEILRITDENRKRPIHLDVWFPTKQDEKPHNYGISKGQVSLGASIQNKRFPILLLSHGAMGAASNYSWLAEYLARSGYIVLGVSHYGESLVFGQNSIDSASVSRFGDRTRDLNFALDFLIERSKYALNIDSTKVGAIGHSSGGSSVLMISGAEFSAKKLAEYCSKKSSENDKGCNYPRSIETDEQRIIPIKSTRLFKALVAIDPAVGQGFGKNALKSMKTRTLIIGSAKNDFLPFESHAGYLAKQIKNSEIVKLDSGEGHFVYLDECNLPINVMGVSLCSDRQGVDRKMVHQKLAGVIENFLARKLK